MHWSPALWEVLRDKNVLPEKSRGRERTPQIAFHPGDHGTPAVLLAVTSQCSSLLLVPPINQHHLWGQGAFCIWGSDPEHQSYFWATSPCHLHVNQFLQSHGRVGRGAAACELLLLLVCWVLLPVNNTQATLKMAK